MDGNEYIEYEMGLRSVALGHAYEPVVEAAYQQMLKGINFNRLSSIEVECAENLLDLIDGAEMVNLAFSSILNTVKSLQDCGLLVEVENVM